LEKDYDEDATSLVIRLVGVGLILVIASQKVSMMSEMEWQILMPLRKVSRCHARFMQCQICAAMWPGGWLCQLEEYSIILSVQP